MCVRITGEVKHTHTHSLSVRLDSPLLPVALARGFPAKQPGRSVLGEQLSEVRGQRLQMDLIRKIQMCLGVEGSRLGEGGVHTQRHPELKERVDQCLKTVQSTLIITF